MKRKLPLISVAVLHLLILAATAMASETDWLLLMRAATTDGTHASAIAQFGTKTGALNGYDFVGDAYTSFANGNAAVGSYQPTWPGDPPIYTSDKRAPMGGLIQHRWDILVWLSAGYAGSDMRLYWYGAASHDIPASIQGVPLSPSLYVIRDPTGKYTGQYFPIDNNNNSTSADNPFGQMIWSSTDPNFEALKMSPNMAKDAAVHLRLTFVPEPNSLLAFGGSLIGLAGYSSKRRSTKRSP